MTSANFMTILVRGIAAVVLCTLTMALLVVAPAQLRVRDDLRPLTAQNASMAGLGAATNHAGKRTALGRPCSFDVAMSAE